MESINYDLTDRDTQAFEDLGDPNVKTLLGENSQSETPTSTTPKGKKRSKNKTSDKFASLILGVRVVTTEEENIEGTKRWSDWIENKRKAVGIFDIKDLENDLKDIQKRSNIE